MKAELEQQKKAAIAAKNAWERAYMKAQGETNPGRKKELTQLANDLHAQYVRANVKYQMNLFVN
jgi:hypothetical protein